VGARAAVELEPPSDYFVIDGEVTTELLEHDV
jgi:hypothetical protein